MIDIASINSSVFEEIENEKTEDIKVETLKDDVLKGNKTTFEKIENQRKFVSDRAQGSYGLKKEKEIIDVKVESSSSNSTSSNSYSYGYKSPGYNTSSSSYYSSSSDKVLIEAEKIAKNAVKNAAKNVKNTEGHQSKHMDGNMFEFMDSAKTTSNFPSKLKAPTKKRDRHKIILYKLGLLMAKGLIESIYISLNKDKNKK